MGFVFLHEGKAPAPKCWPSPHFAAAPQQLHWQLLDDCEPHPYATASAGTLQTVEEVARFIQTTRQTVSLWLRERVIPCEALRNNLIRLDLETVLHVLEKRAARKYGSQLEPPSAS